MPATNQKPAKRTVSPISHHHPAELPELPDRADRQMIDMPAFRTNANVTRTMTAKAMVVAVNPSKYAAYWKGVF
jgi:hypothetical protein